MSKMGNHAREDTGNGAAGPREVRGRVIAMTAFGLLALACAVLVVSAVASGAFLGGNAADGYGGASSKASPAAESTGKAESEELVEVRKQLDEQAADNAMTVKFAKELIISDSGALLGFSVPQNGGGYAQSISIVQNGMELYRSEVLEPGQNVAAVDIAGLHDGAAEIIVRGYRQGVEGGSVHYLVRVRDKRTASA